MSENANYFMIPAIYFFARRRYNMIKRIVFEGGKQHETEKAYEPYNGIGNVYVAVFRILCYGIG